MKSKVELYDKKFFDEITANSAKSANEIVPFLMELIGPKSVLDVGCAEGAWLSIFENHGITDYIGIDGAYVDRARMIIESRKFIATDLQQKFDLGRKFDLAICLEVAEHLPETIARDTVQSLVNHAPCVLFSASIPFQDGTGHINEQWPNYWSELFLEHGYRAIDVIRPKFWLNEHVSWWFSQNSILYYDPNLLSFENPAHTYFSTSGGIMPLVHPQLLTHKEHRLRKYADNEISFKNIHSHFHKLLRKIAKSLIRRMQ